MKLYLTLFSVMVLVLTFVLVVIPVSEAEDIYDGLIRLHVIANSDSEEDQQLKLTVRDRILERVEGLLEEASDTESALSLLREDIGNIEREAREVITGQGFDYGVNAVLTVEYYPTREYDELTLPAGEYKSLKVIIGGGEGQNWWCVLYPPLCRKSASVNEELAQTGFTPSQIRLITDKDDGKYTMRFRVVEFFSDIKYKLKKLFS